MLSIWVPSMGRIETLQRCIESFITKSSYKDYEIIIIDQTINDLCYFVNKKLINSEETRKYLDELPNKFPNTKFKIIIQEFKPMVELYQQFLDLSNGLYIMNIEDDWETWSDPKEHIEDAIIALGASNVIGIEVRMDGDKYDHFKKIDINNKKYRLWKNWCCLATSILDKEKLIKIDAFNFKIKPHDYYLVEVEVSKRMVDNNMIYVIPTEFWGFLAHIQPYGINGRDRTKELGIYQRRVEEKQYGRRGDVK